MRTESSTRSTHVPSDSEASSPRVERDRWWWDFRSDSVPGAAFTTTTKPWVVPVEVGLAGGPFAESRWVPGTSSEAHPPPALEWHDDWWAQEETVLL